MRSLGAGSQKRSHTDISLTASLFSPKRSTVATAKNRNLISTIIPSLKGIREIANTMESKSKSLRRKLVRSLSFAFLARNGGWECQAFAPPPSILQQPVGNNKPGINFREYKYCQSSILQNARSLTKCHERNNQFFQGGNNDNNDDDSILDEFLEKQAASGSTVLLLLPAAMALLSFSTYPETAKGFHSFVDIASGHTWAPVDGGAYLTELITPALTGPVASFISLLFGTLTSMTVGQLYNRQNAMSKLLGELLEDLRLAELHIATLPTAAYRKRGEALIQAYGALLVTILEQDSVPQALVIQRREAGRRLMEQCMELLHRVSGDKSVAEDLNGRALDEAYATLNRLIRTRSSLITTYENSFPIWHYGNLCILAMAILFIFLVLTDKTALLFLGGFQLRMCWAMLIGTLSMLLAVIFDLNSPLGGTFTVIQKIRLAEFDLDEYMQPSSTDSSSSRRNKD
jgi:hypothetical protein